MIKTVHSCIKVIPYKKKVGKYTCTMKIKQRQTFLHFHHMSNQGFYFIDKSVII